MDRQGGEPRDRGPGTGKSHLAEAVAHAAIEKDLRVAWFTLETLTAAIAGAKADGSVARTVDRICRSDLVVVDDIGMLPAGQDATVDRLLHHAHLVLTKGDSHRLTEALAGKGASPLAT